MSDPVAHPLADLGLPASLVRKLEPMATTRELHSLRPEVFAAEWKLTEGQWDRINKALRSRGLKTLPDYVAPPKRESKSKSLKGLCRKPMPVEGSEETQPCGRALLQGRYACLWHWLLTQPIEVQEEWADQRRRIAERAEGYAFRARVPESEWPEGHRWCSECQAMIPFLYVTGTRCKAHASRAAHASMTKRVYDFGREDYDTLLAWQGGRCYICQQVPRAKRLAVDHDHRTGAVRGLLCASDEWGCNHTLQRVLNSKGMAERLLAYVTKTPLERMVDGEDGPAIEPRSKAVRVREREDAAASVPPRTSNDPFKGFL